MVQEDSSVRDQELSVIYLKIYFIFKKKGIKELKVIDPLILIISSTDLGLGKLVKP
jgi:hypothetical protein